MSKLHQQIALQNARIDACRQEVRQHAKKVKQSLSKPAVLCSGLVGGFLVGYFVVTKPQSTNSDNKAPADEESSLQTRLTQLLTSPLFLLAINFLKDSPGASPNPPEPAN